MKPVILNGKTMALTLLLVLASGCAVIQENDVTAESLLREALHGQRNGDFEATWQALMAFFAHPRRNAVEYEPFLACFGRGGCWQVGRLGAFLGKSRQQADRLSDFCPDWNRLAEHAVKSYPGPVDGQPVTPESIRRHTLGDSCDAWHSRQLALLHDEPVAQPAPVSHVAPLRLDEPGPEQVRPTVEIRVGGNTVWATATTGLYLAVQTRDRTLLGYLAGAKFLTKTPVWTSQGGIYDTTLRMPTLQLGESVFREVIIKMLPSAALAAEYSLGMDILQRYQAACFQWQTSRLYLGTAAPCREGVLLEQAYLPDGFVLYLDAPMQGGSTLPVLLNTGSGRTYCSNAFIDANGGQRTFSFGPHPALSGECQDSRDRSFPAVSSGGFQAEVGMDTLLQFDAFGWELNPLRVYFVPKA